MPTLGDKKKPQLLRAVAKPDNVGSGEVAKARPVYIDGLTEGGGAGGGGYTVFGTDVIESVASSEQVAVLSLSGVEGAAVLQGVIMANMDVADLQPASAGLSTMQVTLYPGTVLDKIGDAQFFQTSVTVKVGTADPVFVAGSVTIQAPSPGGSEVLQVTFNPVEDLTGEQALVEVSF